MNHENNDATAQASDDENASDAAAHRLVFQAIEQNDWSAVERLLTAHPHVCRHRHHHKHGYTILHWLCSIGATPVHVIDVVAALCPAAIAMIDADIGDTCLHIVCRNSQFSSAKLKTLLQRHPAAAATTLLVRNRLGGTALHSAVHHNAVLDAIRLLVQTHPQCVLVKTHEGISVITALWSSFVQTIQGHLFVARALQNNNGAENVVQQARENSQMIDRFWNKLEYLALQVYRWSEQQKLDDAASNNERKGAASCTVLCTREFLLHGLLRCNAPLKLFLLCLRMPEASNAASALDTDGNTPLHVLVAKRPYRTKEHDAIVALLQAAPSARSVRNVKGDMPIHIALRNRIPFEHGVDALLLASSSAVPTSPTQVAAPATIAQDDDDDQRDIHTGLFPFLLAAEQGGRVAINTTYQLLLRRPGEAVGPTKAGTQ